MHIRQVEAAGHSQVPEGAHVKVRIGQGQKGPEVTEVVEVDTSATTTAEVTRITAGPSAPRSSSQQQVGVGATTESNMPRILFAFYAKKSECQPCCSGTHWEAWWACGLPPMSQT